ncbi:hypothetical protein AMAG_09975 [Allomyces macrogynus ATCC 38327]|uniref:Uncharacterized protein n=1 Tax=Allomyces macrogynus (strain ATCC 38327) TaxID=578462 RepID=A0A0L0SQJ3_ALLM3|nr:hypothetical protein AMAG_09975 [Allomyces macrogynus ATCC 38327]|eukprot:KNE64620.1 hypothetical protein AMAG_09975 [Allomyces macrogynus ATCC 38327]
MTAQVDVSPGPGAIAAAGTGAQLPTVPRVDASFPDPAQPRVPGDGVPPTALANAGSAPQPVFSAEKEQCQAWMAPGVSSNNRALWITGCLWTPSGYQCQADPHVTLAPSCSMGDVWNPDCAPTDWLYPINTTAGTLVRVRGCVGTADTRGAFLCLPESALSATDELAVMLRDVQVPCFLNVESHLSPATSLSSGSSRSAVAGPPGSAALCFMVMGLVVVCRLSSWWPEY